MANRLSADEVQTYLANVAEGARRRAAAEMAGVEWAVVCATRDADAVFAAAELDAEEVADDLVEQALHDTARSGNVKAIETWLFNRRPAEWKDPRSRDLMSPEERDELLSVRQADLIERTIRAIFGDMGLTPAQEELIEQIVPRHLRLVTAQDEETGEGAA